MTGLLIMLVVISIVGFPLAVVLLVRWAAGSHIDAAFRMSWSQSPAYPSFARWWSADRDRAHAAREVAQRYGLSYVGDSREEQDLIAHFFLFRHKPPGVVEELVLSENAAMRESLFTYYDRPRWRSTFAHFTSARLNLPEFRLSGRNFPMRDLTLPAIAFEDDREFNAGYEVRGPDETPIRRVLGHFVRARLAVHGGFWIEGKGRELLCGKSADYTTVEERDAFFRVAREICALFADDKLTP